MDRMIYVAMTGAEHILSQQAAVASFVQNFTSGYVQRAIPSWPKQGSKAPWRVYQNYFRDVWSLKWSAVDNKALEFSSPTAAPSTPVAEIAPQQLA